ARGFDLLCGDKRACNACAEQVILLVDCMRAEHREAVLLSELATQIHHDHIVSAAFSRLVFDAAQLASLTKLRRERNQLHAGIALLQPRENDGGVQATRVGKDDLLWIWHGGIIRG